MLDPWLIWPTVHRGMNYKKHNIKNLGQDPNTFKGNPIWKEYRQKGFNIEYLDHYKVGLQLNQEMVDFIFLTHLHTTKHVIQTP